VSSLVNDVNQSNTSRLIALTRVWLGIHKRNEPHRTQPIETIDHQHDSSSIGYSIVKLFLLDKLLSNWKCLARELDIDETEIDRVTRENICSREKFSQVEYRAHILVRQIEFMNILVRYWISSLTNVNIIYVKYSLIFFKVSNNVDECHTIVIEWVFVRSMHSVLFVSIAFLFRWTSTNDCTSLFRFTISVSVRSLDCVRLFSSCFYFKSLLILYMIVNVAAVLR
jgi:hypothetical protein